MTTELASAIPSDYAPAEPAKTSRTHQVFIGVAVMIPLILIVLGVAWMVPYWHPTAYLQSVAEAAAPTIAAIDAYTARVGYPPDSLADLLPQYDASKAATGYPRQDEFEYHTWRKPTRGPDNEWVLVLYAEWLSVDADVIQFDSQKRKWEFIVVR